MYLCDYKKPMNENENNIIYDNNGYEINQNDKSLFTKNNLLLFGIIYIVITIISFYIFTSSLSLSSLYSLCPLFLINLLKTPEPSPTLTKDNIDDDDIDPKILSKINDNIDIGFNPPNMDNDDNNVNNSNINNV
jgi:hypothetical protein